jgi:hypothetical protein
VYKARVLKDAETLASYNVVDQATLMMATVHDTAGRRFDPVHEVDEEEEEHDDDGFSKGRRGTAFMAVNSFRKPKRTVQQAPRAVEQRDSDDDAPSSDVDSAEHLVVNSANSDVASPPSAKASPRLSDRLSSGQMRGDDKKCR